MAKTQDNVTFLDDVDMDKVKENVGKTDENSKYFNEMCNDVVHAYCEALDNLMLDIHVDCVQEKFPAMSTLQSYYMELMNMIYFMTDKLEAVGVKADMALSAQKEVYSKSCIASSAEKDEKGKSKSTVAETQAFASMASQYESVVASVYDHAYKIVKGKVEAAQDMGNCLRRIIASRTEEMRLSYGAPSYEQETDSRPNRSM